MGVLVIGIHAVLSVIVWTLTVASLASTSWIVNEAVNSRNGLFRYCDGNNNCKDHTEYPETLKATIAFLILANLFIFFALVCSVVAFLKKSKGISFISSGLHSFVFIFLLITVVVFPHLFNYELLYGNQYGWGYIVAIAACICSVANVMSSTSVCR
eukprot:Pgem_evm1s18892